MGRRPGAVVVCETLQSLGVDCLFGLPGTQNIELYEALRRSGIRAIVATHELAAAFMANGYARASSRPGVLLTIPGPGFSYALTGLAEAFLDSAPLLHIAGQPATRPGRRFQLQALDQQALARPIVKRIFEVERVTHLSRVLREAYALTRTGEPGPVLVQIRTSLLSELTDELTPPASSPTGAEAGPIAAPVDEVMDLVGRASRILLYVGQGAVAAASELRALAEILRAPVVTTTSARGILPEDHPLCRSFDFGGPGCDALNEILELADLVLAVGCKFSHNGAHGFRMRLASAKLVHVDAARQVLGSNYPCRISLHADAPAFLRTLLARVQQLPPRAAGWPDGFVESLWRRARERLAAGVAEPRIQGADPPTPQGFFAGLRKVVPAESCIVTDSGLHQTLARRYFTVLAPRGLLTPTDLQSMGFGLPAAIGAKLAVPDRPVVALVGDGGLASSGLELLTAVRERIPLTVIVFNDGQLGLIRLQQLGRHGHAHGTRIANPDFAKLAQAVGAAYLRVDADAEVHLRRAASSPGVTLVEVILGDTVSIHRLRAGGIVTGMLRRFRRPRRGKG